MSPHAPVTSRWKRGTRDPTMAFARLSVQSANGRAGVAVAGPGPGRYTAARRGQPT